MKFWDLKVSKSFNPRSQKTVGLIAAQLDEQLGALKKSVAGLTVKQLEWQLKPGMNTIGMLLAHLAIAEYYWVKVGAHEIRYKPRGQQMITRALGFEDEGLPLPPAGKHPKHMKGMTISQYITMLDKSRRIRNNELKKWSDKSLGDVVQIGKRGKATKLSILHHVFEHLCSHFGQILMLKHMMRDAGVLKVKK